MKKGFTLVEIMLVVAIIVVIVAIALPNLLRIRMNTNEVLAQKNLRAIAAAYEMYFSTNGVYPNDDNALIGAKPPYLNRRYCNQVVNDYTYICRLSGSNEYTISASPARCGIGGVHNYYITTGMRMLPQDDCSISPATPVTPAELLP